MKDVSIVDEAITNDFEDEGTSLNTNEKSDDLVPSSDVITIKKDVAVLTLKRTKSSVILPYIASTEKETVVCHGHNHRGAGKDNPRNHGR